MLRWILVESAWQLVRRTGRWRVTFERLSARIGRKKAIVAIVRQTFDGDDGFTQKWPAVSARL